MKRLYLRIYLAVLASLAAFALLASLAWHALQGEWQRELPRPGFPAFVARVAADALPAGASADALAATLARWRVDSRSSLTLYDGSGAVLAAAGQTVPLASAAHGDRPPPGPWPRWWRPAPAPAFSLALPDGRTLMVERARRPADGRPLPGFVATLALIALAVGVGAYPVARRLTRRLESLQRTVEAVGAGNLSARARIGGHDEVAALADSFNRSADRIEQLVRSQRGLLANASHELRSPLARIRMAIALLPADAPAQLREELARNVAELDALVDEILLASRLEAVDPDSATRSWESVDLAALAAEEGARVGAELELAAGGPEPLVAGDARLLRRLVRNLLENAVRHGGGTPVDVRLSSTAQAVALEVCDRGPGVPEDERERIFEPFYRARGASERAGGVGLGLSLVRQIARHHGGDVECRPRDGGGSCFRVRLPAERLRTDPARRAA